MAARSPTSSCSNTNQLQKSENEISRSRCERSCPIVTQKPLSGFCELSLVNRSVLLCSYFAVIVFLIQVISPSVSASPILLSPENTQGPVSVARNIRHLPCISRRTGEEGVCMFAIDCLKANGSHLGTCIDRFYFGSCCQIPEKNAIVPIVSNNIEENSIEGLVTNAEKDKLPSTTERLIEKPESINDVLKPEKSDTEHKPSKHTDDINKVTVAETTSLSTPTYAQSKSTEVPIKLSTFQTVVNENSTTEKTTNSNSSVSSTTPLPSTAYPSIALATKPTRAKPPSVTSKPVGTKKPQRPLQKPTLKPTYRPQKPSTRPGTTTRLPNVTLTSNNSSRPYANSTSRPRPTKPVTALNTTRKPPYKPPPKRTSPTKRPVSQPPRLNITFISQGTTSKPGAKPNVTNKPHATTITYINTTTSTLQEDVTTITTLASVTTTPSTTAVKITSAPTTLSTTTTTVTTTTKSSQLFSEKPVFSTETTPQKDKLPEKEVVVPALTTITLEKTTAKPEISTEKISLITLSEKATESTTVNIENEPTQPSSEINKNETVLFSSSTTITEQGTLKPDSITEIIKNQTESSILSTPEPQVLSTTEIITKETYVPTLASKLPDPTTEVPKSTTETPTETPVPITVTEKQTETPTSTTTEIFSVAPAAVEEQVTEVEKNTTKFEDEASPKPDTSTPYPPGLVTWSSNVDVGTKSPDAINATTEESWSPITPPEGWILISTLKPNLETPASPSTTASPPSSESSSIEHIQTTSEATASVATETTVISPNVTSTTVTPATEVTVAEFTVNVTLTPTVPSSTESFVPSTFGSASNATETLTVAGNFTETANITESTGSTVTESSSTSVADNVSVTPAVTPIPHPDVNSTNFKDMCGRRLWPEGRIVGGAKSGFGRWPWQISLRQWRTSTYLHKCGAALLNENWAITAAHCVEHVPPSELLVRLGEHDLAHEAEPYGFAERRVQIVASHPHFDPATFEYDLALLRFYEPVTFQPNILPVCVPDSDDNFVGKTAHVTGWGRLYDEGPLPSVLQEVSVPVINNTACEGMYRAAGYNEHIPNIFICAGWKKGGADSCEGDSGGPMVIQRDDNRFVLGGVISWGIGCAEPNQPGVYTRISEFRDWINQILQF